MGVFSFFKTKSQKQINFKQQTRLKLGLSLSGGGAKGFAHIGVLRAFEEIGLNFDIVTGTSVGSIVGALYSAGIDSRQMEEFGKRLKTSDVLDKKILISPSKSKNVENLVKNWIGDVKFCDLSKRFACIATNIKNGAEVILQSGSVATAVSASCSAPIFFDGVELDEMRLYDGGLTNNLPSDVARRMGADIVVGVTLSNTGTEGTEKTNLISVAKSSFGIILRSTSMKGILNSDVLISPILTGKKSSKLEGIDVAMQMITAGYDSAKEKIPTILKIIDENKRNKK